MSRTCTICTLPADERQAIDTALIGGEPARSVASRYVTNGRPLGRMAVQRHKEHLPATLVKAEAVKEATHADDLVEQLKQLRGKAISLLLAAERAGDLRTALAGVREARATIELLLEVEERIDRRPVLNVTLSPEWAGLRAVIVGTLDSYPEAKRAVVLALSANGGSEGGANR